MATGANTTPLGLNPIIAARQAASAIPALQNRPPSLLPPIQQAPLQQSQVPQKQQSGLDISSRQSLTAHIEAAKRAAEAVTSHLPKRRKTRWGTDSDKATTVPTQLPSHLSDEEQKKYLIHIRIEELNKSLRSGDYGIPDRQEDRSPSPEPIYDHKGVRLNTRESRVKKRLEEERHKLIQDAIQLNPDYKPPTDYKPPQIKIQDRVSIPQDDHPHINFIGLIIGPRGNTLKKLEKDTNTKVMIRGKGSVKEGKTPRPGVKPDNAEDEELHALVTGQSPESVKKCVDKIKDVIRQGVDAPEGQSDLKRLQLLELAALNGTLRADEVARCRNCGATSHKTWECPEQTNFTNEVMCAECGGRGHVAKDCIVKKQQPEDKSNIIIPQQNNSLVEAAPPNNYLTGGRGKVDAEYQSFMAELTGKPAPGGNNNNSSNNNNNNSNNSNHHHHHRHHPYGSRNSVPPPSGLTGKDNTGGVSMYDRSKSGPMPWNRASGAPPHAAANNPPWANSSAGQTSGSSSMTSSMHPHHGQAPPGVGGMHSGGMMGAGHRVGLMQHPMSMAPPGTAPPPPPGVQQYPQMGGGQPPPPGSMAAHPWQQQQAQAPAPWQQGYMAAPPGGGGGGGGGGGYAMPLMSMGPPGVPPANPPPPGTQPPWASGPPR